MAEKAELRFIGVVEKVEEEVAWIRILPEYCQGLLRLSDFSHIVILYWLHLRDNEVDRKILRVTPRRHHGAPEVGVFACRSPSRPNPIGFSVSELVTVESCTLIVKEFDALEGTPIVDIKPYLPRAESISDARTPEWTQHGPKT